VIQDKSDFYHHNQSKLVVNIKDQQNNKPSSSKIFKIKQSIKDQEKNKETIF